ncbi:MAG: alpha/beta hydrolase [Bacteroidota bacterium]
MYRRMVEPLLPHFRVVGMESRPLWPGSSMDETSSWEEMADDLIAFFDQQGWQKVVAVGHSLGAAKIVFASLKRPDLFSRVALVEPPLLPKWIFNLVSILPIDLRKKVVPPSRVAEKRTDRWPTDRAFFDYIRPKRVFAKIPDDVLMDYVTHTHKGIEDGTVRLRYPKEWESHVYASLQSPWDGLSKMTHPTLAIRGTDSDVISPRSWEKWQRIQGEAEFKEVQGGHLVPFESPTKVGECVARFLVR